MVLELLISTVCVCVRVTVFVGRGVNGDNVLTTEHKEWNHNGL